MQREVRAQRAWIARCAAVAPVYFGPGRPRPAVGPVEAPAVENGRSAWAPATQSGTSMTVGRRGAGGYGSKKKMFFFGVGFFCVRNCLDFFIAVHTYRYDVILFLVAIGGGLTPFAVFYSLTIYLCFPTSPPASTLIPLV